jgi:hypothetical protein
MSGNAAPGCYDCNPMLETLIPLKDRLAEAQTRIAGLLERL